jgi:integrase
MERHGGRDPGRKFRRCLCPIHTEGHLGGLMYRRALEEPTSAPGVHRRQITSWTRAQDIVRQMEARGSWDDPDVARRVTIADAVEKFMTLIESPVKNLQRSSVQNYKPLFYGTQAKWQVWRPGLLEFSTGKGVSLLVELDVPTTREFASTWNFRPSHASKQIQLLRKFFRFCLEAKWIKENPALALEHPRNGKPTPTLPFDGDTLPQPGPEWRAIVAQCQSKPRLLALTLLMRYVGLRISDAATFKRNRVMADGSIFLYTQKTGQPVTIPMHPELKTALEAIAPNASGYYFWSGESAVTTATDNWRRRYEKLFKTAGIEKGHPHRLRDTFAVDLLVRGVPLDQVSILLGHSSVKVTEKHYLAFVAARRQQIAEAVRRAWATGTAA